MQCALSIGNTHIAIGLKNEDKFIKVERYKTKQCSTLEEFEQILLSFFSPMNISKVKAIIVASVVPSLDEIIYHVTKKILNITPFIITQKTFAKLNFDYSSYDASSLGIDRLVVSYIVKKQYELPAVAIDFGTATTLNVLNQSGEFLGGAIIPSTYLLTNSLSENTALLNGKTSLIHVSTCIGNNTLECISIGILQGMGLLIDGLLKKIDAQFAGGLKSIIATGGGAEYILPYCNYDICCRKEMLLEGIFLIHNCLKNSH